MTVDVECAIEIARPRELVAAFAADPDNVPAWYANISEVSWRTPRPLVLGSRVDFVAHFLGRRLAYTYELRELDPGRRLVMSTAQGPFPMRTTYLWSDTVTGGTRMVLRNQGHPAGFSRLVAPFLSVAVRRANRKDLALLKATLEAGP